MICVHAVLERNIRIVAGRLSEKIPCKAEKNKGREWQSVETLSLPGNRDTLSIQEFRKV